jgi:hypothetical protein
MFPLNLLLNCLLTAVICALLSAIAVFWISLSSNNEGSDAALSRAYSLVMVPLAGAILGLVIGVFGSLLFARPTYLKLLGIGAAITILAGGATIAFVWKMSDREPTIDGKLLDVEFELKTPPGFQPPDPLADRPRYEVYGGGVNVGNFALDLTHVTAVEGGWIIHDFFPLQTRRAERSLHIALKSGSTLSFDIDGETSNSAFNWSPWIAEKNSSNFQLRYKLRPRTDQVKKEPDEKAFADQAIAALSPDAPMKEWFKHLRNDLPRESRDRIATVLEARQAELVTMIKSGDAATREQAVTAAGHLNASTPELDQAILDEGRAIAAAIKRFNSMSEEDPHFHSTGIELSSRFDDWRKAWWAIRKRIPAFDATPLRDIQQLSMHHRTRSAMQDVEANASSMLEALDTHKTASNP